MTTEQVQTEIPGTLCDTTQNPTDVNSSVDNEIHYSFGTPGVYAVVADKSGKVATLFSKTKTGLVKTLNNVDGIEVLAVFKGKQLNLKQKVSFTLN